MDERFNTDASRTMQVIRSDASRATFIGVKGTGTYRAETLPDSTPIASVFASRPGYDTDFSARVIGRGRRARWSTTPAAAAVSA